MLCGAHFMICSLDPSSYISGPFVERGDASDIIMATLSNPNGRLSMLASILLVAFFIGNFKGAQSIGVCYGRDGNNLPSPSDVIQLYKSKNIPRMRIYDERTDALDALRNSGIEVIIGVPNDKLQSIASDASTANNWVQNNIRNYWPAVKFRYIAVGNEVFPDSSGGYGAAPNVLPAMKNIYNALNDLQGQIKVSTAVYPNVLGTSYPPGDTTFNSQASQYMGPIVQFLAQTGSPLLSNIYPYFTKKDNPQIELSKALFTNTQADQYGYTNLFDQILDAHYSAVEKAGGPNVEVVVSESGWPSDGDGGNLATTANAQTYNQNLINHVGKGTPKKPGQTIEAYIFAMFNENQKGGDATEKYFGLFNPDKTPVYPITFI